MEEENIAEIVSKSIDLTKMQYTVTHSWLLTNGHCFRGVLRLPRPGKDLNKRILKRLKKFEVE
jgi:hypothetical protein